MAVHTVTIAASDFEDNPAVGIEIAPYIITDITQPVVDEGAVVAYVYAGAWAPLAAVGATFTYEVSNFQLYLFRQPGTPGRAEEFNDRQLKVVIIYPPAMGMIEGVDVDNYDRLAEALGVAEEEAIPSR